MADGGRAGHRASRGCGTRDRGMVVGGSLCASVCVCARVCAYECTSVQLCEYERKEKRV